MLRGRCSCAISGRPTPLPRAIFAKGYSSTPRLLATSYTPLATALLSPIIPACPERFLRRVLIDAPLSLVFPVHPRNSPVSPIIPVHTQKQGGGALKTLSATSDQRPEGKRKADPVHHSIPGGSNQVEEERPASEGGPYTNCELSAVNCKPGFLT